MHNRFLLEQALIESPQVDPWLLAHGILFLVTFSILMPLTTFLILFDRKKYFVSHKLIGILIIGMLVAGWATLGGSTKARAGGDVFAPMNTGEVGSSHSVTGTIARFCAIGVCMIGVLISVVRMPKRVHATVKLLHGVGGGLLSLFGPIVVWNGWVRLSPILPPFGALSESPMVWLSLTITLGIVLMSTGILNRLFPKLPPAADPVVVDLEMSPCMPDLSLGDILKLISDGDGFVFIFENFVVRTKQDWEHPGGNRVLTAYSGQDITSVFLGRDFFSDAGVSRTAAHSDSALGLLMDMRIGRIQGMDSSSTLVDDSERTQGLNMSIYSIDEEGSKTLGIIVLAEPQTASKQSPVMKFSIKIVDSLVFTNIVVGSKLRLSLGFDPALTERPYTVAAVDERTRCIDLFIKIYPEGQLTSKLASACVHDSVFISQVVPPGKVSDEVRDLLLLAAGTGIVPMLSYLTNLPHTVKTVSVFWWVRHRQELFLAEILEPILQDKRVSLKVCFSSDSRNGRILNTQYISNQRVSREFLLDTLTVELTSTTVIMSGPAGFIQAASAAAVNAANVLSLD